MNKDIILTLLGTNKIYAVILTKYQMYTSTTIPKNVVSLAKVNKSPYRCFYKIGGYMTLTLLQSMYVQEP